MSDKNNPSHIAETLSILSSDIVNHLGAGTTPAEDELRRWVELINNAAPNYWALETACEDLVEDGVTAARMEALKRALTHAQGQNEYWTRKDRWQFLEQSPEEVRGSMNRAKAKDDMLSKLEITSRHVG